MVCIGEKSNVFVIFAVFVIFDFFVKWSQFIDYVEHIFRHCFFSPQEINIQEARITYVYLGLKQQKLITETLS